MRRNTSLIVAVLGLVLVAPLDAAPAGGDAPTQRRWVFTVDNGKPAGELVERCDKRGDCDTRYIFKDNGRCP